LVAELLRRSTRLSLIIQPDRRHREEIESVAENTQTQTGVTVGGGAEYALWNNLSVRAEYLYVQFNGVSVAGSLRSVLPPTTTFTGSTGNLHDHIVRIGLNYKFGYGAVASSY
jgi:outer membrane immunogenic protein